MRYPKLFVAAVAALALGGCLTLNLGRAGPQDATGNAGSTGDTDETSRTGAKSSAGDSTIAVVPAR